MLWTLCELAFRSLWYILWVNLDFSKFMIFKRSCEYLLQFIILDRSWEQTVELSRAMIFAWQIGYAHWTTRWANLLLLMFAILLWIRSFFKLFRTICSRVKFKWSLICFRNILSWFFRWIVSNQQLSHPLMDAPEFRWLKRNHDSGDNRTDHCTCPWSFAFDFFISWVFFFFF